MSIGITNTGILTSNGGILDEIGQYMTFYDEANTTLYFDATGRFPYSTDTAGTWLNLASNTKLIVANTTALGATVSNTYGPNAMIFNNSATTAGRIDRTAASNTIIGPAITSGTGKMTAAVWAYNTNWYQTTGQRFVSSTQTGGWSIALNDSGFTGTTTVGIVFYNLTAGGYRFMQANTRNAFTSSTGWNHLAWTFDGKYGFFYINGQVADTYTASATTNYIDVGGCLAIGAEAGGVASTTTPYLSGALASIFVSNRAFSNTEMYNLFVDTDPNVNLTGSRTYVVNSTYSTATTVAPNTPAKYYSNGALRATGTIGFDEVTMNSGSLFFNGSSQYLTVPAGTAFAYGTGDFTIEGWINPSTLAGNPLIWSQTVSGTNYFIVGIDSASSKVGFTFATSGGGTNILSSTAVTTNTWYHFAVVRISNVVTVYVNGVGGTPTACAQNFTDTSYVPTIGRYTHSASQYFGGYITNLRVLKGTGLYTANFTPPKSSILDPITNTSLLLQCANSTTATVDSSPNQFTVTNNGAVTYSAPGISYLNSNLGSILFNGSNQYLTVPNNAALQLPGDFTIELWVFIPSTTGSNQVILSKWNGSGYIIYYDNVAGKLMFAGTAGSITQSTSFSFNQWIHIAITRSGNVYSMYVNGVASGTFTSSSAATDSGTALEIGRNVGNSSNYLSGYVSNLRIIKGTALYTANFTPPTRLLQPITNTQLLLQVANSAAYITDSSSNALTVTNVNGATYSPVTPVASVGEMQKIYSDGTISVANYFDETIPLLQVSTLIIAGGGGGSAGSALVGGGGGGAGGLISTSANLNTGTWTVTVGQGGAAGVGGLNSGANGTNTVLTSGATTYTAIGGGAGSGNTTRYDGGSGGGIPGGSGTPGQALQPSSSSGGLGSNGSLGSGSYGGGPCDAGSGGGAGGGSAGYSNSISGSAVTYSAGGAGGAAYGTNNGSAGATYGSGGGGGGGQGYAGAAGANGAIIISYAGSQKATGGTVTTVGANTVHTFTANGTFTY